MENQKKLREHLLGLLEGKSAHVDFAASMKGFPRELRGKRPKRADHSPWELLEHLRIAQWDILEFMRNPKHESPEWPGGYWPKTKAPPEEKAWRQSVKKFQQDQAALARLVKDERTDLFQEIPHGNGQTILREVLLVADHNAYHLGQMVLLRKLLGAWR